MQNADEIIKALEMQRHSREGGYFRETFRSIVKTEATKQRRAGTSILYLLKGTEVSRWHQVRSDEIWMYHAGSTARQILLFPDGSWTERIIGPDILSGEMPQSLIPAWTWQATALTDRSGEGERKFFVSDDTGDFERLASIFLGWDVTGAVGQVDISRY